MAETTIIAPDTVVSATIDGAGDLSVQGRVDGDIELTDTLTIAPDGRVDGEISARQVVIEGVIQGTVAADERVVLAATARAVADIQAPVVEMADGALLRGELTVSADASGSTATATSSGRSRSERRTRASRSEPSSATSTTSRAPTGRSESTPSTTGSARQRTTGGATTTTTVVEESEEAEEEPGDAGDQQPEPPSEPEEATASADTSEASEEPAEPSIPDDTFEQYRQDFTVKELRSKLRDRDLQVSGTKDELIERLLRDELAATT